ncbi:WAS/WASL-interacting protein family member 3 [Heteronotia binoei]|uniref:WAS/WASL-interacting protein family member 3 n=1 Tax=Heteronotia binoei TaxID=13085 RepID=UPI00292DEED0|nr:WAS/WASL-interacting protein family member 3 [Heteronotia binoei]
MFLQFFTASPEQPKPRQEDSKSRSALLAQIRRGTRLRKVVQTDDRSAPQVENSRRRASREGGSLGMGRNDVPQALGSLFADGFPVLRPVGQRDLAGNRTGQPQGVKTSPPPISPGSLNSNEKTSGSFQTTPESPKPADQLEISGAQQAIPARPTVPAPPPPPPLPPFPSGKPLLIFPPPPLLPPPPAESPDKPTSPKIAPPPPPQNDKPLKTPTSPSRVLPPPLPLGPPCGLPGRTSESPSPSSSQLDLRSNPPPMLPPPPPPAPSTFSSHRTSLPSPPSPTYSNASNNSQEALPPLPPKSLLVQSQLQKPTIQSLPLPPTPPGPQQAVVMQKRRPGRGGGKLTTPPVPPARSPTTELSSKCQYAQIAMVTHELHTAFKNGTVLLSDDFEAKFTFHSLEEFPPPDEFKPFQKIYPSQEAKDNPPLRTQVR